MQPTHARQKFLWLIYTLAVITYLDRVCISAAAPAITAEFNFTPTQMGYIFSAFTFAYAAFEIPSGWLGDRFGTRLALTRIVLWWSAFTALTGAVVGFWSMALVRFLFGMGEAGAFPNIARSVAGWLPPAEQGRGLSRSFMGLATGAGAECAARVDAAKLARLALDFCRIRFVGRALGLGLASLVSRPARRAHGSQRRRTRADPHGRAEKRS
jgi:MFS family permease